MAGLVTRTLNMMLSVITKLSNAPKMSTRFCYSLCAFPALTNIDINVWY